MLESMEQGGQAFIDAPYGVFSFLDYDTDGEPVNAYYVKPVSSTPPRDIQAAPPLKHGCAALILKGGVPDIAGF